MPHRKCKSSLPSAALAAHGGVVARADSGRPRPRHDDTLTISGRLSSCHRRPQRGSCVEAAWGKTAVRLGHNFSCLVKVFVALTLSYMVSGDANGVGIFSSASADRAAKRAYGTTANNYGPPATDTSDAFTALDLESGELACKCQTVANDVFGTGGTKTCARGTTCVGECWIERPRARR